MVYTARPSKCDGYNSLNCIPNRPGWTRGTFIQSMSFFSLPFLVKLNSGSLPLNFCVEQADVKSSI